jgi:acylphosphatase
MPTARKIKIRGKVQGVNFRYYTTLEARKLRLTGTVENLEDGSVLVTAEGEAGALESLIKWCRRGPLLARVDAVEVDEVPVAGHKSFVIVR